MHRLRRLLSWLMDWETALGLIRLDDETEDEVRRRVHARCSHVQISDLPRFDAQVKLDDAACEEIVAVFRERYPGSRFERKRSWPAAVSTLTDGEAIIDLWLGHDFGAARDGTEPVRVTVDWRRRPDATPQIQAVLKRKPAERPVSYETPQIPAKAPVRAKPSTTMQMLNSRSAKGQRK
jgi:hypothetical protein